MKAKLIKYKQEMFTNYILKNEDRNTIATSRYPFAIEKGTTETDIDTLNFYFTD